MKLSNYNFFYPFEADNNQIIAFNTRTSALALIEVPKYDALMAYINDNLPIEDEDLLSNLKKGGYLVEDEVNELDLIKFASLTQKYSTKSLSLTIAPTLNCNFDCVYCYEKESRKNSHMSKEVQDKIVDLVKKNAPYIDSLNISWYGGEPLLELDTIEQLGQQLIDLCAEEGIKYSSGIITNGYKLTRDVALKLNALNVSSAQVTLDGPREIHDKRRPLVGGQGSFDEIMKRIAESSDILKISLRINTDNDNASFLDEVLNTLEQYNLKNKISVNLGYVEPVNDCYNKDSCMTYDYFSKLSLDFLASILEKGFGKDITMKYPKVIRNYCGAAISTSYVIDPEGYLYKCWSDIGIENCRIGGLMENQQNSGIFSRLMDFLLYDPTSDTECKECKLLPICMGGCPKRRLSKNIDRCSEFKYTLDTYIKKTAFVKNSK